MGAPQGQDPGGHLAHGEHPDHAEDPGQAGPDVYKMQEEIGHGCPVCFMEGDELLEGVIQEINALRHTCDKGPTCARNTSPRSP